jgi:hypothetical protein
LESPLSSYYFAVLDAPAGCAMMVRLKDAGGIFSIWSPQSWAITGIWLLLAFFCYEMMRQQADRVFHLAEIVQGDIRAYQQSIRHSAASSDETPVLTRSSPWTVASIGHTDDRCQNQICRTREHQ